jgi:signal transduction histidine kinase
MDVTVPESAESRMASLYKFWDFLTKPKPFVPEDDRRRVRLLSTLLLFFALITTSVLVFSYATLLSNPANVVELVVLWAAFALCHTKYYRFAAYLALGYSNAHTIIVIAQIPTPTLNAFSVLIVFIILATLLLSLRDALILMVLNVAALALMPLVAPQHPVTLSLVIMIAGSLLLIVFSVYRDVLERDRQAQLKESLKRSEEANNTLIKANALAKEAVRLKSEFMSTMSHELRTPLNAIMGFCGIMLEGMGGEIDDEARHMIERVHSNSERLLELINQVLDIAKIEADRIDIKLEAFSPHDLVTSWKSQMQVLAEQKGLTFNASIDPALPIVIYGDADRITQIATNLLSNAFKFTGNGSVDLRLKNGQDTWQIEVQDTGIGIPPHALNYIFDEFRQLDGSPTRMYGGTGLGLAIVRKLSVLMGGNVRVTSTLDVGSTFTVTLPLNAEAAALQSPITAKLQTEQ